MNEKELKLARETYNELMQRSEEKIKNEEAYKKESKDSILEKSFGVIAQKTEQSNNIYVFIGYYGAASQSYLAPLAEKNPHVRYVYFVNLETTDIVMIEKSKISEFSGKNVTLFLDDPKKYHNISFYREKFNELRNKYFSYLVNKTQEEAIKQIIKKR